MDNTMTNHPERIFNWLDSQLSIARFAGSITINGTVYIVAAHEEGQPLVRRDVKFPRKPRAAKKRTRKEQVADALPLPPNAELSGGGTPSA